MVRAKDVVRIYQQLLSHGIEVWLTGGWGIDALLGEQTRPHKDLDLIMLVDDVVRMRELLSREGYGLQELWSENRWATDARGAEIATAFVLNDAEGREIDVHVMCLDEQGNGIPAWEAEGLILDQLSLSGEGVITGVSVWCLSPEMQMLCHTGYALPDVQRRDLALLQERFGVEVPGEPSHLRQPAT
jgi:lincosamide nucleotidyltransferase A/C/D/E